MSTIVLAADADPARVLDQVRATFESRDHLWQPHDERHATASEGGRPVHEVTTSQRLRISVTLYPDEHRVDLTNETVGAAYAAGGGPLVSLLLAARFRSIVRAVTRDLDAAGLR